ncbi:MAG TPA: hypothetical protein VGB20_02285 [bacterium]
MLAVAIVSPREVIFEGDASSVVLPGEAGVFEVLPFHQPLLSRLLPGTIFVDDEPIPILRGVVKVARDSVIAIVDPAGDAS